MANSWDAVFDCVRVHREPGEVYYPTPTDAELDKVDLGAPLPVSYRAFALRFGLGGDIGYPPRLLRFAKEPEEAMIRGSRGTVVGETAFLRKNAAMDGGAFAGLISRCVCFGCFGFTTESAIRIYVWDPHEVTDSAGPEYAIYEVTRDYVRSGQLRANAASRAAGSFFDFVSWAGQQPGGYASQKPGTIRFAPLAIRRRYTPNQLDITLWLAWNNNTARDLALSIRDRGQTDAFPILADALQEAGCENADLLDSCRTGDPDIDGKWVLQVLLGKT